MLVLGHRGASRAARENTPEAFRTADEMGADGVELDVRLGPDGRLVVYHDALPDDPELVAGLPDLAQVLEACGDRMLVNIELKNAEGEPGYDPRCRVVEPTVAELDRWGELHAHRWLISSFSWETIQRCRQASSAIPTAFLVLDVPDAICERVAAAGHVAVHPWHETLTAERVRSIHAAGLAVNAWTCNEPARLAELAAMGVDGVCTDVPDAALAALGRSGGAPAVSLRWGRRG